MKKILLIFGGPTNEYLISCKSAKWILENIDYKKFDVSVCGITKDGNWYKFNNTLDGLDNKEWFNNSNNKINNIVEYLKMFDVVFPLIHGTFGEDGKISGMLDIFGINYVGSSSLAHAIGYDKYFTKIICDHLNIRQVKYVVVYNKEKGYIKKVENNLDYPVVVKPCCCGSSIGVNVAKNRKELTKYIKEAFIYDSKIIVEDYIVNKREFECGILDYKKVFVSSVGEIVNNSNIYDYDSKYVKKTEVVVPAFINDEVSDLIKKWSLDIFRFLGCKSLARVDFLYDEDNDLLYFNEINTIPGFTNISMYSKVFCYDGIDNKELINMLIDSAK